MRVLSLFDGISCGYLALERAGIEITSYYASEIDKHATAVSYKNYPSIIRLGDINTFSSQWPKGIDLVMGGSPCQGFSFAGKQTAFDDPRSKLFFKFVEIVSHYGPKYFLLENVRMRQECQDVISKCLGVAPICINSSLVSAQNRVRYYWTNIPNIRWPVDKGLVIKDVLEDTILPPDMTKTYVHKENNSSLGLILGGLASNIKGHESRRRVYRVEGKAPTLLAASGGQSEPKIVIDDKYYRKVTPLECERLQTLPDNYTLGASNAQRYKMLGNGWTVDVLAHIFKEMK